MSIKLVFSGRPIFVAWAVPKHKYVNQEEHKVKQESELNTAPSLDFEEGL